MRVQSSYRSATAVGILALASLSMVPTVLANDASPAEAFDLSHWKLTLPMDGDQDGNVDEESVSELQSFTHPDYFHLDDHDRLVFVTPNSAFTTPNSSNARTELRQMLRGEDTSIGTKDPGNNFALASHPNADEYSQIGGFLEATLKVEHVAMRTENPERKSAYSVVVGQIHAGKNTALMQEEGGFGHGNEPLKIYYKKRPGDDTGSVFWNYERNLGKEDPLRTDISHAVWGGDWNATDAPDEAGVALGESFSYRVEVKGDTLHLTFSAEGHPTRRFEKDLASNIGVDGNIDSDDNPNGYAGDGMYFKAGSYNQCNTKPDSGACEGTGNWATDQTNGDYVKVVFSSLESGPTQ